MAFHRDADPIGGERVGTTHQEIRVRSKVVAAATLACPECDAPVAPGERPLTPRDPISCPYCGEAGRVRDFLSLAAPTRPAHVEIRIR